MPDPVYFDGQRLPASYANFYIANQLVLVPTFNDPHDAIALVKLAELFPRIKSWESRAWTSFSAWVRYTA
jgi:agmatine deiminase